MAMTEVAIKAAQNPDITMRNPSFRREGVPIFTKFANGMAMNALWSACFSRRIKIPRAGVAHVVTTCRSSRYLFAGNFKNQRENPSMLQRVLKNVKPIYC